VGVAADPVGSHRIPAPRPHLPGLQEAHLGRTSPRSPTGCLGFRAQAAVAVLTGGAQLTRRVTRTLLAELLGLPLSLGTLSRVEATVSAALAPAYAEIAGVVRSAPTVNCDETPWRQPEAKPWLWTATRPRPSSSGSPRTGMRPPSRPS